MRRGVRNILSTQVLLATVAALIVYGWQQEAAFALAALYGGGIAIVNTLLLARRANRAAVMAEVNLKWSALSLYAGMFERFFFTALAFAVGMGPLGLPPIVLLAVFAGAQLAYVVGGARSV